MFTGLVDHQAELVALEPKPEGRTCHIRTQFNDLALGESIAVDGICLTVTAINGATFSCDISAETQAQTTAATWQVGRALNVERALRAADRFAGHIVLGHIDALGEVKAIRDVGECMALDIRVNAPELLRYAVHKGCITVDGVSLTINAVSENDFSLMIIPHTWQVTNLSRLEPQTPVNLEFDYIARIVLQEKSHV